MFEVRINSTNSQIITLATHLRIQLSSTKPPEGARSLLGIEAAETKEVWSTPSGHSESSILVKRSSFRVRGLGSLTCKMGLSATADVSGTFLTPYWPSPNFICNADGYFHPSSEPSSTVSFPPQASSSRLSAFCPRAFPNVAIICLTWMGKLNPKVQKH